MARSLNLLQPTFTWKKVAAATLVLAIAACVFPDAADAQRRPRRLFRFSGVSNDTPGIDLGLFESPFSIDTAVEDSDPNAATGQFENALQNFTFSVRDESETETQILRFTFASGDLVTSLLDQSDLDELETQFEDAEFGVRPPNDFTVNDLITDPLSQEELDPIAALFANGGIKYEVVFDQPPTRRFLFLPDINEEREVTTPFVDGSVKFTFFTPLFAPDPLTRFNSINALQSLESSPKLQGVVRAPSPFRGATIVQPYGLNSTASAIELDSVQVIDEPEAIPEPTTTAGLLGIGAMAIAALYKRRQSESNLKAR